MAPLKFAERVAMGFFNNMLRNAADRVAYGFLGSHEAVGRLNLSKATAEVTAKWKQFAGRKGITAPTVRHVSNFMAFQYGVDWDDGLIAQLADDASRHETLDMALVLPRIADLLLDSGALVVERA